jgi:hypothetical protein
MEPPPTDPLLGPWYLLIPPVLSKDVVFKLGAYTVVNFWSETTSYMCFSMWNPVGDSRLKIIFSGIFEGT